MLLLGAEVAHDKKKKSEHSNINQLVMNSIEK